MLHYKHLCKGRSEFGRNSLTLESSNDKAVLGVMYIKFLRGLGRKNRKVGNFYIGEESPCITL